MGLGDVMLKEEEGVEVWFVEWFSEWENEDGELFQERCN
jgi:hypothetical protein